MKIYLLNFESILEHKISQYLFDADIPNKSFRGIKNIALFTSITTDSILIIGDSYYIRDYSQLQEELTATSNAKFIFILAEARYQKEMNNINHTSNNNLLIINKNHIDLNIIKDCFLINRQVTASRKTIKSYNLFIDLDTQLCSFKGIQINLTSTEMNILYLIMTLGENSISHEEMQYISQIQGKKVSQNTVVSHIRNVRNKIYKATGKEFIKSVYGYGYRM